MRTVPRPTRSDEYLIVAFRAAGALATFAPVAYACKLPGINDFLPHDMKLVMGISDRIYVVNQGTPLANGTPEEIRNNPDVIRAYLGEA